MFEVQAASPAEVTGGGRKSVGEAAFGSADPATQAKRSFPLSRVYYGQTGKAAGRKNTV
tara:strand:+ start:21898 stop:22074 length:177 start_codon:yes stop_codon:yes gene_type:complete